MVKQAQVEQGPAKLFGDPLDSGFPSKEAAEERVDRFFYMPSKAAVEPTATAPCSNDSSIPSVTTAGATSVSASSTIAGANLGGTNTGDTSSPIFYFDDDKSPLSRRTEMIAGTGLTRNSESDASNGSFSLPKTTSPVSPPSKQASSNPSPTHSISSQLWPRTSSPTFASSANHIDTPSTAFTSGYASSGGLATASSKTDVTAISPLSFTSSASTFHLNEGEHDAGTQGAIEMEITRLLSSPNQLPRASSAGSASGSRNQAAGDAALEASHMGSFFGDPTPFFPASSTQQDVQQHRQQVLSKIKHHVEAVRAAAAGNSAFGSAHEGSYGADDLPPPVPTVHKHRHSHTAAASSTSTSSSTAVSDTSVSTALADVEAAAAPRRHGGTTAYAGSQQQQHPYQGGSSASPGLVGLPRQMSEQTAVGSSSLNPSPAMNPVFGSTSSGAGNEAPPRQSPRGMMFRPKAAFESLSPLAIPSTDSIRNIWGAPDLTLAPSALSTASTAGTTHVASMSGSAVAGGGAGVGTRVPSTPSTFLAGSTAGTVRPVRSNTFSGTGSLYGASHAVGNASEEVEAAFPSKLLFSGIGSGEHEGRMSPLRDFSDSFATLSLGGSGERSSGSESVGGTPHGLGGGVEASPARMQSALGSGHVMGRGEGRMGGGAAHRQYSGDALYYQTRFSSMLPPPVLPPPVPQSQHRGMMFDEFSEPVQRDAFTGSGVSSRLVDTPLMYRNLSGTDLAGMYGSTVAGSGGAASRFSNTSVHTSPLGLGGMYSGYSPAQAGLGAGNALSAALTGSALLPSAASLGLTSPSLGYNGPGAHHLSQHHSHLHHGHHSAVHLPHGHMAGHYPLASVMNGASVFGSNAIGAMGFGGLNVGSAGPTVNGSAGSGAPAAVGPDANLPIVREIQTSKLRVDETKLTRDYFDSLTREAREIIAEITPTMEEMKMQEGVFEVVQEITRRVFPDSTLHHFGSTANGFSLTNSDMDLCICLKSFDTQKISPAQCVEKIGHALKQAGMKDVKMLTRARVPIVKMRDPVTGIRCDLGFQNNLAIYNTRLLKTYSQIDPRFRELVFIVKYWSKRRNINEPYFGTLSSYCYVLMIIHLLQMRGVLPCLQRICPDGTMAGPAPVHPTLSQTTGPGVPPIVEMDGHDVYFYDNLNELGKHWQSKNSESLGELVVAFFKYYSAEFPYVHGVASVRAGRVLSKEEKGWTKERQQELNRNGGIKDRFWLCVEDPFEVTHNIGRPVDKETLYEVRGEFIRASKYLCAGSIGEPVLGKICEKQNAQPKKSANGGSNNAASLANRKF
ncbi:hypothetical protein HDU96_004726 [Phlyctochytrium bullatum]|nr:hypothetical protein HDU96_004726 [Phlyctochytrium bullatum]